MDKKKKRQTAWQGNTHENYTLQSTQIHASKKILFFIPIKVQSITISNALHLGNKQYKQFSLSKKKKKSQEREREREREEKRVRKRRKKRRKRRRRKRKRRRESENGKGKEKEKDKKEEKEKEEREEEEKIEKSILKVLL